MQDQKSVKNKNKKKKKVWNSAGSSPPGGFSGGFPAASLLRGLKAAVPKIEENFKSYLSEMTREF